jgi:wobble nucleotide-excising tRNase
LGTPFIKWIKLDNIGKFKPFNNSKNEFKDGCNIVFGFNGSGKSALSKVISLFGDEKFISKAEKDSLYDGMKNGDSSSVEIKLSDGNIVKYSEKKPHSYSFYVFNSNFVASHVFDGTKGNAKGFSNAGELTNEEIRKSEEKIRGLSDENDKLKEENKSFEDDYENVRARYSKEFREFLTDKNKKLTPRSLDKVSLPNKGRDDLETELKNLKSDYKLSLRTDQMKEDLAQLEKLNFQSCSIDQAKVNEILKENVESLSKETLEKKISEVRNLFSNDKDKQNDVEGWFKFGKDILHKTKDQKDQKDHKCPICDSDISNKLNFILEGFDGYFDKSYEGFIKELTDQIRSVTNSIESVERSEKYASTLEKLWERYKTMLSSSDRIPDGRAFPKVEFSKVERELKTIKGDLEQKKKNIQHSPESKYSFDFTGFNEQLKELEKLGKSILTSLTEKQLKTSKIEDELRKIYEKIIISEFNGEDGKLGKYKENDRKIDENGKEIERLSKEVIKERRNLKAESKHVNDFLKKMGIEHFEVDIDPEKEDENITIKFKNSGSTKGLKHSISDGEKTALAFAYFLSKFDCECKSESESESKSKSKIEESIVVIDDPISSLDENRLFNTAFLISDHFKEAKQLIVLSHNFLFLKFFSKNFHKGKTEHFLNGDELVDLPSSLGGFESPYFYMLQDVISFANEGKDKDGKGYEDVRKYMPSYIRRVLETFLSFKFAKVQRERGGSPGLGDFVDDKKENINELDLETRKKLKEIKCITDQFLHGNLQQTTESGLSLEPALKKAASYTIEVIETIDDIHLKYVEYMKILQERKEVAKILKTLKYPCRIIPEKSWQCFDSLAKNASSAIGIIKNADALPPEWAKNMKE